MNPLNNFSLSDVTTEIFQPVTRMPTIKSSLNLIDAYDAKLLKYISMLYNNLKTTNINFDNIGSVLEALIQIKHSNARSYLDCLLHPEKSKGCKIPSPIPVPSTSFQLHNSISLSTNKLGNLTLIFNPFFLYNRKIIGNKLLVPCNNNMFNNEIRDTSMAGEGEGEGEGEGGEGSNNNDTELTLDYCTSLFVNNDDTLDGSMPNDKWRPVNIGQDIPQVYNSYRLVSGCIQLRYIGQLQQASGTTGGAIIYDAKIPIGSRLHDNDNHISFSYDFPEFMDTEDEAKDYVNGIHKYGSNDLAQDSYYFQEVGALSGVREIYFPIDNSYEEYVNFSDCTIERNKFTTSDIDLSTKISNINSHKGYNFLLYVAGGVKETNAYKVDIFLNFETLPNASFLNYMPVTTNPNVLDELTKKQAIMAAHNHAIGSLSDYLKENTGFKSKKLAQTLTGELQAKIGKSILDQSMLDKVYQTNGKSLPYFTNEYVLKGAALQETPATVGLTPNKLSNQVPASMKIDEVD